jgi:hypothetical protein
VGENDAFKKLIPNRRYQAMVSCDEDGAFFGVPYPPTAPSDPSLGNKLPSTAKAGDVNVQDNSISLERLPDLFVKIEGLEASIQMQSEVETSKTSDYLFNLLIKYSLLCTESLNI